MKYIYFIILVCILSCDENATTSDLKEEVHEEITELEMIRENLIDNWAYYKRETFDNGDYIVYDRKDSINLKENGKINWYGIIISSLSRKLDTIDRSWGNWNYKSKDTTLKIEINAELLEQDGTPGGTTHFTIQGKIIRMNSHYLELEYERLISDSIQMIDKYYFRRVINEE